MTLLALCMASANKVFSRMQDVTYSSCEDAALLSFVLPRDAPADNRVLCKQAAKDQSLL